MIVVTLKYVTLIMRADNRGEGGIMALTALVSSGLTNAAGALVARGARHIRRRDVLRRRHDHAGHIGAVRGRGAGSRRARACTPYVVPVTLVILVGLFSIQRHGTARVGVLFGPVMCLWFVTLAALGGMQIAQRS